MHLHIGPYINWVGPYQIADLLQYVGVSEDRCYKIGAWLDQRTPLGKICSAIFAKKKRKVSIIVDDYDVWNADVTLSLIILPVLRHYRHKICGSPSVDDEDVPAPLRRAASEPQTEEEIACCSTDSNWARRWAWVVDEMVWTFEQQQPDCDWEAQYRHGVFDYEFVDLPIMGGAKELKRGPNDTSWTDDEGIAKHQARIDNGMRLFAKYYNGLWA